MGRSAIACLLALGVAMLVGSVARAAERGGTTEPAEDLRQLETRLTRILNDTHTPGMGVVIVNRDGVLWSAGLGLADVATGRPATPDTLWSVASISKMFVGLAVLKLVDEGRLALDTPVRDVVPEVAFTNRWEATDPIRVVHLLEHTTGWDEAPAKVVAYDDPKPVTLAEGLALGAESRVSRWRPGTRYSYCNSGPSVAAAVVEKVTGQRFEDYVKATFFDPLGMATADYFAASPRTRALRATLYHEDGKTPFPYHNSALWPSGALNASAREMGALLLLLLRRGQSDTRRLLTEASIRRMETPVTSYGAQSGLTVGYGLCNDSIGDDRTRIWRGHSGATVGASSQLFYLPDQGVGFFFAINAAGGPASGKIGLQLAAYLTKAFPPPPLPSVQPVPGAVSRAYSGWYLPANPRVEALKYIDDILGLTRVSFDETRLLRSSLVGPPATAFAVDGTHFRGQYVSVPNIALLNAPEGRAIVWGDSFFARISAARAWAEIVLTALFLAALVSVPLVALGGGLRWILRRRPRANLVPAALAARVVPLLAWLAIAAAALLVREGARWDGETARARIGHATPWSVGLAAATWAFAVASFAALLAAAWRWRRHNQGHRFVLYHDLVVAIVFVVATLYLGWHGSIGYRSWA
jgi:CubicO group peptidase (beta-lactamase class C family)